MPCGGDVAQRLLDLLGRLTDAQAVEGPGTLVDVVKGMKN
jgi:hypothetical protein